MKWSPRSLLTRRDSPVASTTSYRCSSNADTNADEPSGLSTCSLLMPGHVAQPDRHQATAGRRHLEQSSVAVHQRQAPSGVQLGASNNSEPDSAITTSSPESTCRTCNRDRCPVANCRAPWRMVMPLPPTWPRGDPNLRVAAATARCCWPTGRSARSRSTLRDRDHHVEHVVAQVTRRDRLTPAANAAGQVERARAASVGLVGHRHVDPFGFALHGGQGDRTVEPHDPPNRLGSGTSNT